VTAIRSLRKRLRFHLSRHQRGGHLTRHGGTLAWWYWLVTGLLVAVALAGGPLGFFDWILLAGTAASVLVDYCLMARMLSLLPWNRRAPLTWHLVVRTFLRPPVRGSILGAV
jgi:membrane protein implicated in regulation of membrane protease activity